MVAIKDIWVVTIEEGESQSSAVNMIGKVLCASLDVLGGRGIYADEHAEHNYPSRRGIGGEKALAKDVWWLGLRGSGT